MWNKTWSNYCIKKWLSMWPTSRMFHLFLLWMSHDRPEWYESHGKKRDVGKVPRTLSGHLSTFCVALFTRVGFILYIRTAIIRSAIELPTRNRATYEYEHKGWFIKRSTWASGWWKIGNCDLDSRCIIYSLLLTIVVLKWMDNIGFETAFFFYSTKMVALIRSLEYWY